MFSYSHLVILLIFFFIDYPDPILFRKMVFIFVTWGHETLLQSEESKQKYFLIFSWLLDSSDITLFNQMCGSGASLSQSVTIGKWQSVIFDGLSVIVQHLQSSPLPHCLIFLFMCFLELLRLLWGLKSYRFRGMSLASLIYLHLLSFLYLGVVYEVNQR